MMVALNEKYSNVIPFPSTRREEAPADLIIDSFDQWSNPAAVVAWPTWRPPQESAISAPDAAA